MKDHRDKFTIADLDALRRKGRLHLQPEFQRQSIWNDAQRFGLLDSVYRDYPVPEVFLWDVSDDSSTEEFSVIDGQQRLRAMLDFVNEKGIDKKSNPKFRIKPIKGQIIFHDDWKKNGKKGVGYTDLKPKQQKRIDNYPVHVRVVESNNLLEIEDLFHRLNTNVDPVNAQELRNLIHGDMQKLAQEVGKEIRGYLSTNGVSSYSTKTLLRQTDIESVANEILLCAVRGEITGSDRKAKDDLYKDNIRFSARAQLRNKIIRIHNDVKKLFPGDELKSTMFTKHNNYLALFTTLYLGLIGRCDNKGEYVKFTIPSHTEERKRLAVRIRKFSAAVVNFAETLDAPKKSGASKKADRIIREQKAYFKKNKPQILKWAGTKDQHTSQKGERMDKHQALTDIMWPNLQFQDTDPLPSMADRKWLWNGWSERSNDHPICYTCKEEIKKFSDMECGHKEMRWLGGENKRPNYIPQHKPCNRKDNQPELQSIVHRRKAR